MDKVGAVIVAAGSSRRMGFDKIFTHLKGRPVLAYSLINLQACPDITDIVIVTKPDRFDECRNHCSAFGITKLRDIVGGGKERQDSVLAGLQALPKDTDIAVIHDGARPFAVPNIISMTIAAAKIHGASVAAFKVVDTLKEASTEQTIARTIDRSMMWAVQTPQTFRYSLICQAYQELMALGKQVTDDTAAVESLGVKVQLVDTGSGNIKITTPADLALAEAVIAQSTGN
ncbi:MAG: 2-C-methyl-D-erythritol 4-phosphate cytidylyltransferase [Verrucomicrobiota bacterium]|nr:2-C-methyl-D-erythritol 4-phosphate cytidylyltransferase [Verrucomicrobiota bacterium]